MDLFDYMREQTMEKESPLAQRLRPMTLEEVVGQQHIIGKDKLLYRAIKADKLSSVIFYGPPGTGKTTLAKVIANSTKAEFIQMNATTSGKKEMQEAVQKAKDNLGMFRKKTILFIDEIHRFNKAQQDYLLPFVEDGTVILIGATTENPYFEVNGALISRSNIFELYPLTNEEIQQIIHRAVYDCEKGMGTYGAEIDQDALEFLADMAEGDARTKQRATDPLTGKQTTAVSGGQAFHRVTQHRPRHHFIPPRRLFPYKRLAKFPFSGRNRSRPGQIGNLPGFRNPLPCFAQHPADSFLNQIMRMVKQEVCHGIGRSGITRLQKSESGNHGDTLGPQMRRPRIRQQIDRIALAKQVGPDNGRRGQIDQIPVVDTRRVLHIKTVKDFPCVLGSIGRSGWSLFQKQNPIPVPPLLKLLAPLDQGQKGEKPALMVRLVQKSLQGFPIRNPSAAKGFVAKESAALDTQNIPVLLEQSPYLGHAHAQKEVALPVLPGSRLEKALQDHAFFCSVGLAHRLQTSLDFCY